MVYYAVGSKVPIPPTLTYALFFVFRKKQQKETKFSFILTRHVDVDILLDRYIHMYIVVCPFHAGNSSKWFWNPFTLVPSVPE
jgi:hypothetical protein